MTVYVPQQVMYKNTKDVWVPKYNLNAAELFGEVEVMLEHYNAAMAPQQMISLLRNRLKDFCDDDHILPMGDPVAIGAAIAIAADFNHGRVKILKWRGKNGHCYTELQMNIRGNRNGD